MSKIKTICFSGTDCWSDHGLNQLRGQDEGLAYDETSGYIPSKLSSVLKKVEGNDIISLNGCGQPYEVMRGTLDIVTWKKTSATSYFSAAGKGKVVSDGAPSFANDTLEGYSMEYTAAHALSYLVGAKTHIIHKGLNGSELPLPLATNNSPRCKALGLEVSSEDRVNIDGNLNLCWLEADMQKAGDAERIEVVNLIGHSRGGVTAIVTANLLAKYLPYAKVNIICLDPVPGSGRLKDNQTTLRLSNVNEYIGIYAVDETSGGFNGVVPKMVRNTGTWDPLENAIQPTFDITEDNYKLIFSRGRHATIPGSRVNDGTSSIKKVDDNVGAVGNLIYRLCINALERWQVTIPDDISMGRDIDELKKVINANSETFDDMRRSNYGGTNLTNSKIHYNKRGITSKSGIDPRNWNYLESFLTEAKGNKYGDECLEKVRQQKPESANYSWKALVNIANACFSLPSNNSSVIKELTK